MNVHAWAENAVIISDDGSSVKYHVKCPYCGTVDTMCTRSAHVMHGIHIDPGVCSNCNCGKPFNIRFGRS